MTVIALEPGARHNRVCDLSFFGSSFKHKSALRAEVQVWCDDNDIVCSVTSGMAYSKTYDTQALHSYLQFADDTQATAFKMRWL